MSEFFQIAADKKCPTEEIMPLLRLIRQGIFPIIQIGIPILLLIMGSIDLGKAVISSEDKEIKAAQSRLIKKVIAAVLVFLLPVILSIVIDLVANNTTGEDNGVTVDKGNWYDCWQEAATG